MAETDISDTEEQETAGVEMPSAPAKAGAPTKSSVKKADAKPKELGKEKAAAISGPLVTVVTRNQFYRDGFRNMLRIVVLEAVIIVGLILTLIVYMNTSKAVDRYFATTADGRIMQLVPLDKESMSLSAVMSWVAQAASETMTFGYHDYQRRLQQSSRHFTRRGWESFTSALQNARIIESVRAQQQVVTAEPRAAPILKQRGVFQGKYRWLIELPLKITYKSGSASRTDSVTISLVIERVPSLENPNGVGIEQWFVRAN